MRARRLLRVLGVAALLTGASVEQGTAQDAAAEPATLIADRVEIDPEGRLVASGAVEAVQGGTRLSAERIVYDGETGSLRVDGPITLSQGGEETIVLADAGELSSDLRDGLLRSARLVLDRKLQLAAAEINRVEGRYTQLSKVVASACEVCAARPVPLWQIRSSRVIHDQETRQIYFFDPRFELYGVPVFYLPRLRLPDPTVERATGFLVPEFAQTDELGFGVKQPYFIALAPSRDLTLTPYLSPETATLEGRYRQVFRRGSLQFDGAISRDSLRPGRTRGYLFGSGGFGLPRGYALAFDAELASDADYLDAYGVSGKDRLDSAASLSRVRRDRLFFSEGIFFDVPGEENVDETRPDLLGDAVWVRRFTPGVLGGRARLRFAAHGHRRPSEADADGRDVGRLEAEFGWRRDAVGPGGLLLAAETRLLARYDAFGDDSANADPETVLIPTAAVTLRWPWAASTGGTRHVIEPVAQLVWTQETADADRPAEESRQIAFDEGNLFALSRFPAGDRLEDGLRANLGVSYTRHDPAGWTLGLTAGRILRAEDRGQFDGIAALEGATSDWLLSAGVTIDPRISLSSRAVIDDDFDADRFETRIGWRGDRLDLAGSYAWLAASPAEERPEVVNQWRIDGAYRVNERWRAEADLAYDIERDRAAATTLGLEYRANCVTMDVGLTRRFTDVGETDPTTSISFQLALAGFGEGAPRPPRLGCAR